MFPDAVKTALAMLMRRMTLPYMSSSTDLENGDNIGI